MSYHRLESGISGFHAAVEQPQSYSRARRTPGTANQPTHDRDEFAPSSEKTPSPSFGQKHNRVNVPLLEVSADVNVVESVASTVLTQVFNNTTSNVIKEATYVFPLYEGATVVSFCARIGPDTVVKGVVKPKGKAQQEYDEAVANHKIATMMDEHTPEIFETKLGNIPPATLVRIDVKYINQLKPDVAGKGLLLTIPTSIARRYGMVPSWMPQIGSKKSVSPTGRGMKIRVEVSTNSPISQLNSLSHVMDTKIGFASESSSVENLDDTLSNSSMSSTQDRTRARATLSRSTPTLDRDVVLLISVEDDSLLAPKALMEHSADHPNNSAMMLSFTPSDLFSSKIPKTSLRGEIIFVVDRSGSMWDKVDVLKHTLQTLLDNLPRNNCIFNICSFGFKAELLWPSSVPCSGKNFRKAQEFLRTSCEADMGGTELMSALQKSVESKKIGGDWPTQIMVLTDGEVWDYTRTIDYVHQIRKKHEDKVRFFGLGIGDEVSHQLLEDIGRFGGGFSEIIPSDLPDLRDDRVKRMLNGALTPETWECKIKLTTALPKCDNERGDVSTEKSFIQAPIRLPTLNTLSSSTVYFLFDAGEPLYDTVKVSGISSKGLKVEESLPIRHVEVPTPRIHCLAAKSILKELENGKHPQGPDKAREECERLGTEWSIIGKWTSFVGVNQTNGTENMSRLYKAQRMELDSLTKPRHIDPFSLFRGHKFLPWGGWQSTSYDDNDDDDDDNDDNPDDSGEGTSSKRVEPKFCTKMRSSRTSRRRHDDDDDDGGPEDWYGGGGYNGSHGTSRLGKGASHSSASSSSSSSGSNQDTGTSVQWITKSAFASLHDQPWSSDHGSCCNDLRRQSKLSIIQRDHGSCHNDLRRLRLFSSKLSMIQTLLMLLDSQLSCGAFSLNGHQAKEGLLSFFRSSTIAEINSFIAQKGLNRTTIVPRSIDSSDIDLEVCHDPTQILHTILAMAYLNHMRHGYGKGRKDDITASIAKARGWLGSAISDAHLLEEFANNGFDDKVPSVATKACSCGTGALSRQSQMVFFRRHSDSLHFSQPTYSAGSVGSSIVSHGPAPQGAFVALDTTEICPARTLDNPSDKTPECSKREE